MLLPYNFYNPPHARRALPLQEISDSPLRSPLPYMREATATVRAGDGRNFTIRLVTDSRHLELFFRANWENAPLSAQPNAWIIASSKSAKSLGLDPSLDSSRGYHRAENKVYLFGNEFYGNVKITVRGLCSALSSPDDLFVHACALDYRNKGVLLCGASGAGKTTLTAELLRSALGGIRIVNDDWGCVSTSTAVAVNTGEPALHMKYSSVATLATAAPSPHTFLSENYSAADNDPYARLMMRPDDAFRGRISNSVRVAHFFVVRRAARGSPGLRSFDDGDWETFRRGAYAAFYDRTEHFMNGSLFMTKPSDAAKYEKQFQILRQKVPFYVLENAGPPEEVAQLVLSKIAA